MQRKTKKVFIVVIGYLFRKLLRFAHFILAVVYLGRKKTVPEPPNPLLLKSATQLAEGIRQRTLKSEEVVKAYIKRIREVEPYINSTIQQCFESALVKARAVDKLVASGKQTEEEMAVDKPLLGVPFSVKALLPVKGFINTGCSKLHKDDKATESAPSVSLMQAAGAIVIAITNAPEYGIDIATNNLLYGRTCNPYDTTKTSGGSSGGEGALISAAGSVMGLGNDVGGSIRIPSLFNGIFGHKPSRDLVPNGCFINPDGKLCGLVYTGPMCRYAEDLIVTMRVLSSQSESRLKFGREMDFRKLKIFYILELKDHLAAPVEYEIQQSIKKAATHFATKYGTTVKQVHLPSIRNANDFVLNTLLSSVDNLKKTLAPGKGDGINEKWDLVKYFFGKSNFNFNTLLSMNFHRNPVIYKRELVPHYQKRLEDMAKEFEDLLDEDSVLLMPTFPVTAPYHNETFLLFPSWGYTALMNILGLPATHCPTGLNKNGLPTGIQIVARKNNDPLTIACAVELEKAIGGWISPGN